MKAYKRGKKTEVGLYIIQRRQQSESSKCGWSSDAECCWCFFSFLFFFKSTETK